MCQDILAAGQRGKFLVCPVATGFIFLFLGVFPCRSGIVMGQQPNTSFKTPSVVEVIEIETPVPEKLSLFQTRQDMLAFSQRLRSADEPVQRIAAIVDLCGLYLQIISDPRFSGAQPLQGYRGRIAAGLQRERKQLVKQLAKQPDYATSSPESGEAVSPESGASNLNTGEEYSSRFTTAIVDPHWELAAKFAGGTGPVSYHASGLHSSSGHFLRGMFAGQLFDQGPELVAIIEAILHPDFWQVAGGEGTIHYYRPLMAMVIRATTTVHEDIEDFLERLR